MSGLTFNDVKDFLQAGLIALGRTAPVIAPAVDTDALAQKLSPQQLILMRVGNGAGFTTEALFDRPFIFLGIWGKQNNFADAESLALDCDRVMTSAVGNVMIGGTGALYITRTGGRPQLVDKDAADRYHFTCTYLAESQTGYIA